MQQHSQRQRNVFLACRPDMQMQAARLAGPFHPAGRSIRGTSRHMSDPRADCCVTQLVKHGRCLYAGCSPHLQGLLAQGLHSRCELLKRPKQP